MNEFDVEILPDGTIKIDSGQFGAQQHVNAEAFLKSINLACGGAKQERKHKHGLMGAIAHQIHHATGNAHQH
jgi:hypothetical protein